jgi:hypothetical protein
MDFDQTQAKAKYDNGLLVLPKKTAMSAAQRLVIE